MPGEAERLRNLPWGENDPDLAEAPIASMRDPAGAVYRTRDEVEREKQRDPIVGFSNRCLREGVLTEADIRLVEKSVNDIVDESVAFADASPEPPPEWLLTDVYKD